MLSLYYTVSDELLQTLRRIDALRADILLTPLPPKLELQYRWETNVARLHAVAAMLDLPVTKTNIIALLSRPTNHRLTAEETLLVQIGKTIQWLSLDWVANPSPVGSKTIGELVSRCLRLTSHQEHSVQYALAKTATYLASGKDHAAVQAAVAYEQVQTLPPLSPAEKLPLAVVCAYLYLFKYGLDLHGLTSFEPTLFADKKEYERELGQAVSTGNLTHWSEFFAKAIQTELSRTRERIAQGPGEGSMPASFWQLSDRQKAILGLLDEPGARLTNKLVQRRFRVSQITASRDLSRLTVLGLVYPRGKGRSVSYSRI